MQLGGSVIKRGNKAGAPQGTGGGGMRLTPPNDPLPHLHTKELAPLFWILLINTCIEALSIQGPIQGKNFLSPLPPPSFPSPLQPFLPFAILLSLPLSPFILSVFQFFFSSVGSVWIRCLAVSVR